jgi:hypothetical protein
MSENKQLLSIRDTGFTGRSPMAKRGRRLALLERLLPN